jgi:hypothetical protein
MAKEVEVRGLRELNKALAKAAEDSKDLSALMHKVGMIVVRAAQPPRRTGNLANSLRAGRGKTKAVVRAGNNGSIPYGRVMEYGWAARNVSPRLFLNKARAEKANEIERAIFAGIDDIIRKNKL